jgi:hypothetical protein
MVAYQWENRSSDAGDKPVRNQRQGKGSARAGPFSWWRHSMPKGLFLPSEFVPTKFSTAQDKADFGNTFLHFIESEWARTAFSKSFYNRLSMCFGNIAHYDLATFYETWFTSDADRLRFLRHTLAWPCWGDPEYTFCDVERAIQQEIRKRNYLARYELRAAESARSSEMETLKRLEAKYRPVSNQAPAEDLLRQVPPASTQDVAMKRMPVQGSLF